MAEAEIERWKQFTDEEKATITTGLACLAVVTVRDASASGEIREDDQTLRIVLTISKMIGQANVAIGNPDVNPELLAKLTSMIEVGADAIPPLDAVADEAERN